MKVYNQDFVEYMRGIVTKGGSTTLSIIMGLGNDTNPNSLKYKRKRLNLDETVEQITESVSSSLRQSRAQKQRMSEMKQ